MPKSTEMTAAGFAMNATPAVNGVAVGGLTATPSGSITTSAVLPAGFNVFTTAAASSGAKLPSDMAIGDSVKIANLGANAILLWPPRATDQINAGSAGTSLSIAVAACVEITRATDSRYLGNA